MLVRNCASDGTGQVASLLCANCTPNTCLRPTSLVGQRFRCRATVASIKISAARAAIIPQEIVLCTTDGTIIDISRNKNYL